MQPCGIPARRTGLSEDRLSPRGLAAAGPDERAGLAAFIFEQVRVDRSVEARVVELFDEESKAINSPSLFLTKAGLLTSEGRGKTAMARPSDATNLLLAFLGGEKATDVVNTVTSLRGAPGKHPGKNSPDLPPVDFFESVPVFTYDDLSARAVRSQHPSGQAAAGKLRQGPSGAGPCAGRSWPISDSQQSEPVRKGRKYRRAAGDARDGNRN